MPVLEIDQLTYNIYIYTVYVFTCFSMHPCLSAANAMNLAVDSLGV